MEIGLVILPKWVFLGECGWEYYQRYKGGFWEKWAGRVALKVRGSFEGWPFCENWRGGRIGFG